jgi:hypothetical protein
MTYQLPAQAGSNSLPDLAAQRAAHGAIGKTAIGAAPPAESLRHNL